MKEKDISVPLAVGNPGPQKLKLLSKLTANACIDSLVLRNSELDNPDLFVGGTIV